MFTEGNINHAEIKDVEIRQTKIQKMIINLMIEVFLFKKTEATIFY